MLCTAFSLEWWAKPCFHFGLIRLIDQNHSVSGERYANMYMYVWNGQDWREILMYSWRSAMKSSQKFKSLMISVEQSRAWTRSSCGRVCDVHYSTVINNYRSCCYSIRLSFVVVVLFSSRSPWDTARPLLFPLCSVSGSHPHPAWGSCTRDCFDKSWPLPSSVLWDVFYPLWSVYILACILYYH